MKPLTRVWLAAYVIIAVANLVAETVPLPTLAFVTVVLAMPALVGVSLSAMRPSRLRHLIVGALFFSWLGDWLGDLITPHVLVKIVFFFLGHLCYIAAFWPRHKGSVLYRPPFLILYGLCVAAILLWVVPTAGGLGPAMVAYGFTLGLMAVLATGMGWLTGVGAAVFVVSDTSIAVTNFVYPGQVALAELLIMSTYLVAQLLVVLGVIAVANSTAPDPTDHHATVLGPPGRGVDVT